MVKSYLRYKPNNAFGIITSPSSNVILDYSQRYAIAASLTEVIVWNIHTNEIIHRWSDLDNLAEVTMIQESPIINDIESETISYAVGYGDGSVRIWSFSGDLKIIFRGHSSPISSIAWLETRAVPSSFSSFLATGSNDGEIVIWDPFSESGKAKLKGHRSSITKLFFYDSNILISSGRDSLIKVWDISLQHCFQTILHDHPIGSFVFIPEYDYMVTGSSDSFLRLFKLEKNFIFSSASSKLLTLITEKVERKVPGKEKVVSMGILNSVLFIHSFDKSVELYRILDGSALKKKEMRRKKRNPSKEGPLVTISDTFQFITTLRSNFKIRSLSMRFDTSSSDLKILLSTFSNSIELWRLYKDKDDGKILLKLDHSIENHGFRQGIGWLSYSSGLLASGNLDCIKLWDPTSGKSQTTISSDDLGSSAITSGILLSKEYLVLGNKLGHIFLISTHNNSIVEKYDESLLLKSAITCIQYKMDIMITSTTSALSIWNINLNQHNAPKLIPITLNGIEEASDSIVSIALSSDAKYIAISLTDCNVRIYYRDSLKFYLSLYGHKLPVMAMDFSSDNYLIATASADKNFKIWGLDFGDCHKSIFAHSDALTGIVWVPKTHLLFTSSKDRTIKYWDGDTFELISTMKNYHYSSISSIVISKEGKLLFSSGSLDHSCRMWTRSDEQRDKEADEQLAHALIKDDRSKFNFPSNLLQKGDDVIESNNHYDDQTSKNDDDDTDYIRNVPTSVKSLQSIKSSEKLFEVISLISAEKLEIEALKNDSLSMNNFQRTPLLHAYALGFDSQSTMGYGPSFLSGSLILLNIIKKIPIPDLEPAILMLPLSSLISLIHIIEEWISPPSSSFIDNNDIINRNNSSLKVGDYNGAIMVGTKVIYLVLLLHSNQIIHCKNIRNSLRNIKERGYKILGEERNIVGKNISYLKRYISQLQVSQISVKDDPLFLERSSL